MADGVIYGAAVHVCVECMFVDGECWIRCRASPIAQLVERAAVNLKVAGSNPAGRASFTPITQNQARPITLTYGLYLLALAFTRTVALHLATLWRDMSTGVGLLASSPSCSQSAVFSHRYRHSIRFGYPGYLSAH